MVNCKGIQKRISRGCSSVRGVLIHKGLKVHSISYREVEGTGGVEEDKKREGYVNNGETLGF